MRTCHLHLSRLTLGAVLLALATVTPACGGGGGGAGPGGAGQGLILVNFLQASVDNVPLNEVLEFRFSEAVSAATVSPASIQIRKGGSFGATVAGTFEVQGSLVLFRPRLPSLCDLSDSGFDADTQYRVQIIGTPEEFAVQNTHGQKLAQTTTWEFHTRDDQDPQKFTDAVPAMPPTVMMSAPANGTAAVSVGSAANRQRIVLTMSENLDPCTVNTNTVSVQIYEQGNPATFTPTPGGTNSGFDTGGDVGDQDPANVTTWGSNGTPWPGGALELPASVHLLQDFNQTRIIISPLFGQDPASPELGGQFPDNVLLVVRLTFGIEDFGGQPLAPVALSFTTENTNAQPGTFTILVEGETPFDSNATTADVNTARAPSRIQGYLLFAGDGDNGTILNQPTLPEVAPGCTVPRQVNDGAKDVLDPGGDLELDTGALNTCINVTDGSTAVVWEFLSLRIRSGVTVRVTGSNPALLLVQGDAVVESNGAIRVTGDGQGGTPNASGGNGDNTGSSGNPTARPGGTGMAGGGDGGDAKQIASGNANSGQTGFGSPAGFQVVGGVGTGDGGRNSHRSSFAGNAGGGSAGGGGGGHSTVGADGIEPQNNGNNTALIGSVTGAGGGAYPSGPTAALMLQPTAGSGGGSAGYHDYPSTTFGGYKSTGGAGGAGGGFLDITASGDISVFGTINATGGRGGNGAAASFYSASAGGGGGSGGGIRLLTPNDINIAGGTLTAAGGAGGAGSVGTGGGEQAGNGGTGGVGRLVMEDSDSVISGFGGAITIPTDGDDGFYRGVFDATRFQGGGLTPDALTEIMFIGPVNPTYVDPVQADFVAGAPAIGSPGVGSTVIQIEARAYQILPDGSPDGGSVTGWGAVGSFIDSGNESLPTYVPGAGLSGFNTYEFLQFRFTISLDSSVGPFDAGAFLDTWAINFTSDN